MSTTATTTALLTADEFFDFSAAEGRFELIDGEVRTMTPGGGEHGAVGFDVGLLVGTFVKKHQLGRMFTAETGFLIGRDPDTVQAPDLAFVRKERIAVLGVPVKYFPEAPALVVEVVSPSDTVDKVDAKMLRWLHAGVELGWVCRPRARSVTVYRVLDDIRVLTENDVLDGAPVLPGYTCRVGDFFSA
ncbi:MAG: Uma2 family endonuclease [Pirellulales bacterium]